MYFDRKGNQIDVLRFGHLWEDISYRMVKENRIGDYRVCTIWLGIDPLYIEVFHGNRVPALIFETRVLSPRKDSSFDSFFNRYASEESALTGHELILNEVKEFTKPVVSSDEYLEKVNKKTKRERI